jgi:hypothetical protein
MGVNVNILFLLVLGGIIINFYTIGELIKEINILERIAISMVTWFIIYVELADLLFLLRIFSLGTATIAVSSICGCLFIITKLKRKNNNDLCNNIKLRNNDKYILFAILIGTFFSFGTFEFFGMGQDQGVYETEAINIIYGQSSWDTEIEEINDIDDSSYRDYYKSIIEELAGFDLSYNSKQEDYLVSIRHISDDSVYGYWHGIPAFPSMLALSAYLFGITNMILVQFIFYLCYLIIAGLILKEVGTKGWHLFALLCILAVCPEIVWISKSALTEMFYAVLIVSYLFLLVHNNGDYISYSSIPIISLFFYHVSSFAMIPVFLLVYWYQFIKNKDKKYIKLSFITIWGYFIAFVVIYLLQPMYVASNISKSVKIVSTHNVGYLVLFCCVLTTLFTNWLYKSNLIIHNEHILKRMFAIIACLGIIFTIFSIIYNKYEYTDAVKMFLLVFMIMTGVIMIPTIMAIIVNGKYKWNNRTAIILMLFSWMVVVFSIMMKKIPYYYYYGRYVTPYIVIVVVTFAVLIDGIDKITIKNKTWTYKLGIIVLGFSIIFLMRYSWIIRSNVDDSRLEWTIVADVLERVQDNEEIEGTNNILLDEDLAITLYYPLKAIADNVYIFGDNYSLDKAVEQVEGIDFFVTNKELDTDINLIDLHYYNISETNEDDLTITSSITALPTDINCINKDTIYIYSNACSGIISQKHNTDCFIEGWYRYGLNGCWTDGNESVILPILNGSESYMEIVIGDMIPFDMLGFDEMNIDVYINGYKYDTFVLDSDNQKTVKMEFDSNIISRGDNIIKFVSDKVWSPSEYGALDDATYGFSVNEIIFE